MDWDKFRRKDGSLDLTDILEDLVGSGPIAGVEHAKQFLQAVEELQPIRSRQVASLALATACRIFPAISNKAGL